MRGKATDLYGSVPCRNKISLLFNSGGEQARSTSSIHFIRLLLRNRDPLLADLPKAIQGLGKRAMNISMAESTLDSLFQTLDHVDLGRDAEDSHRCFTSLSNVK